MPSETTPMEEEETNQICSVCKIDENDAKVLLCDTCNIAMHIYCADPVLKKVPKVIAKRMNLILHREVGFAKSVPLSRTKEFLPMWRE